MRILWAFNCQSHPCRYFYSSLSLSPTLFFTRKVFSYAQELWVHLLGVVKRERWTGTVQTQVSIIHLVLQSINKRGTFSSLIILITSFERSTSKACRRTYSSHASTILTTMYRRCLNTRWIRIWLCGWEWESCEVVFSSWNMLWWEQSVIACLW